MSFFGLIWKENSGIRPKFNDFRYAYKASSCYTCSSIDGSSDKCEYMDSKYSWDQLDE